METKSNGNRYKWVDDGSVGFVVDI
jgi:hypothetical protein